MIKHCRTICDVKSLLAKIHKKRAVRLEEGESFLISRNVVTDACKSFHLFCDYASVLEEVFAKKGSKFDISKLQNRPNS